MGIDLFSGMDDYFAKVEFVCKEVRRTIALAKNNQALDIKNPPAEKIDPEKIFQTTLDIEDDMPSESTFVAGRHEILDDGEVSANNKMVDMTSHKAITLSGKNRQKVNQGNKEPKIGRHYIKNWDKLIFNVLNGKEKKGSDIFDELHDTDKIHFKGEGQKKLRRYSFNKIMQRLKARKLIEQVSDERNAAWRWIGGAIM